MEIPLDERERVKELFDAALQLEPPARLPFLERACSEESVRRTVESLLLSYDEAGSFFSGPLLGTQCIRSSSETFSVGEILAGRFRVLSFISKGGIGEVYEADDLELRQKVALKTIRPDVLEQPHVLTRFKREVCLAKAVTHPNICRVFDLFRHQSSADTNAIIFISMELLQGETLNDRLRRVGPMSTVAALPIIVQMTSALDAAHSVGIVHRDFKPGNVMLVDSETPKPPRVIVTDFGLALRSQDEFSIDLTPPGRVIGTPEWMSPEQIESGNVTATSDIYSLGLVIYRMITGVHPFQAESSLACALKRLSEKPVPPRKLVPGLGAVWEGVILKCLERDPFRRFANANQIAHELENDVARVRLPTLRSAWSITLGFSLLLVIGIVAVFFTVRRQEDVRPAATFHWQRQFIQSGETGKAEVWRYDWRDITWARGEGWLGGADVEQGGGGDIGTGILLHSVDRGASWTQIDNKELNSGEGAFNWGSYQYTWHDVGPIHALNAISKVVNGATGTRFTDVWLAATSGVYVSGDNGKTWRRSTPRPDDPKEREVYAHFGSLLHIEDFKEVYASGWQGIAHWSDSTKRWKLELPTYSYSISSVTVFGSGPYLDLWAVANLPAPGEPYGLIYHLKQPESLWERLTARGIDLEPGQGLTDIKIIDSKAGFACGLNGVILRGSKDASGTWNWIGMSSPTKEHLVSMDYDSEHKVLWVVGSKGTVLESSDRGIHWKLTLLRDEFGRLPDLRRVRASEEGVWILGNHVVFKLTDDISEPSQRQ